MQGGFVLVVGPSGAGKDTVIAGARAALEGEGLPGAAVQVIRDPDRARMLELVFPKDTNYHGTAFGGWVLALMDKAASVAAVRHAGGNVVTARMDGVDFHVPIRVGDAVALDIGVEVALPALTGAAVVVGGKPPEQPVAGAEVDPAHAVPAGAQRPAKIGEEG